MKTVLIPLDGSTFAEEALGKGLEHCQKSDEIVLVQCIDYNLLFANAVDFSPQTIRELQEQDQRRCQEYLDRQVARLRERGYSARSVAADGSPVEGILRTAEQQRADQIILTTHGRSGLARVFMGSVAEGVLRRAECPVLIIPSSARSSQASSVI